MLPLFVRVCSTAYKLGFASFNNGSWSLCLAMKILFSWDRDSIKIWINLCAFNNKVLPMMINANYITVPCNEFTCRSIAMRCLALLRSALIMLGRQNTFLVPVFCLYKSFSKTA